MPLGSNVRVERVCKYERALACQMGGCKSMPIVQRYVAFAVLGFMATWGMRAEAELPSAEGQVVLTIVGNIEHTNRPAFDEFEDPFIKYHERVFEKAAEFDLAMLEALGMQEIEVSYEAWPKSLNLSGPRLKDVLEAVGAQPTTLTTIALDGFAVELTSDDLDREEWIVAIKLDGHYLDIGKRGPAWVVFHPGDDGTITAEEEGSWPWAAFFIELQ